MKLTAYRFPFQTERCEAVHPDLAYLHMAQGETFRGARLNYGLTLQDVADGWGVEPATVGELEHGLRRFKAPADMSAALSQLWCWAVEKHPGLGRGEVLP